MFLAWLAFFYPFKPFYTGKEELNNDSLLKVMHEAGIQQPEWDKIGNKLDFKKFIQTQNSAKSFLDGWHAFARESQPSWKLLGIILGTINQYKHLKEQIQQKDGKSIILQIYKYILHWFFLLKISYFLPGIIFLWFFGGGEGGWGS